ncbi:MAG: hypothetical protein ACLTBR_03255 [Anaerostipes sp.]|uniref:hypothetical protein n=1 Tax=Anaerostipes sp. TaxID=1872530 RepID=UPI00399494B0
MYKFDMVLTEGRSVVMEFPSIKEARKMGRQIWRSEFRGAKYHMELTDHAKDFVKFVYNPENVENCSECPANEGCDSWGGNLPCGQQNCWVTVHCMENTAR